MPDRTNGVDPAAATTTARAARYEALFAAVYEPLQRYLRRRCPAADADDVLAEVLLVLWRRLDDMPEDEPVAWSYGVARRCLANHRRGESRAVALLTRLSRERSAPDEPVRTEDPTLDRALAHLSAEERELIRLSAWEELAPREIAVALGISPNAASIRLHRVRRKLEAMLGKDRAAPGHEPIRQHEEGRS